MDGIWKFEDALLPSPDAEGGREKGVFLLHGTAVAYKSRAALFIGPSGSGKSSLALQLMALGAELISDDRVFLRSERGALWALPSAEGRGRIEARGIGILMATQAVQSASLGLVVDFSRNEYERIPPDRTISLAEVAIPLKYRVDAPYFAAAILHFLAKDQEG